MNNKFFWLQKKSQVVCVYCLKHSPTNRAYIGKSRTFQQRIATHITQLRNGTHHCKELKELNAPLEEFSFFVLEVFSEDITDEELFQKEVEWWEKQNNPFNTRPKKGSNRKKTKKVSKKRARTKSRD